jgi:hypothetical protein
VVALLHQLQQNLYAALEGRIDFRSSLQPDARKMNPILENRQGSQRDNVPRLWHQHVSRSIHWNSQQKRFSHAFYATFANSGAGSASGKPVSDAIRTGTWRR